MHYSAAAELKLNAKMDVNAVEEAFLRGEWAVALAQSKEKLARSIVQVGALLVLQQCVENCGFADELSPSLFTQIRQRAQDDAETTTAMSADEERLLSVYLQSVFELEQYDEVETASVIVQAFEPLSFEVSIQWIKFLIAMNRSEAASEKIRALKVQYQQLLLADPQSDQSLRELEYKRIFDVLVFQILLPSESVTSVRETIYSDEVLDEVSKQQLLERVDSFVEEHVRATAAPTARNDTTESSQQQSNIMSHAYTSAAAQSTQSKTKQQQQTQEADDSSTYVMIGGTALALTFAAIGAFRYKDRLRDAVEGVVPAISKGLSDAKYALFEA